MARQRFAWLQLAAASLTPWSQAGCWLLTPEADLAAISRGTLLGCSVRSVNVCCDWGNAACQAWSGLHKMGGGSVCKGVVHVPSRQPAIPVYPSSDRKKAFRGASLDWYLQRLLSNATNFAQQRGERERLHGPEHLQQHSMHKAGGSRFFFAGRDLSVGNVARNTHLSFAKALFQRKVPASLGCASFCHPAVGVGQSRLCVLPALHLGLRPRS